jgi:hypothetical protein
MDQQDQDVFPPMDEAAFAEKLAKWQARGPKKFQPKSGFGRVSIRRVPLSAFEAHVFKTKGARVAAAIPHIPLRKDAL